MFKKLTVAQRLGGAFAILGLGLVLIIVLAFFELSAMKRDLDLLAKDRVPKIMLVKAVQDGVNQTARSLRNVILSAGGADFDKELASLQAARKSVSEALDRLKPLIRSEQGKALLQATGDAREAYRGVLEKVLAASRDGRRDEAVHLLFNDLRTVQKNYFSALDEMTRYQVRLIDESVTQAEASYQNAVWIIAVAAALILAVAGTAAWLTIRRITRQLGGEPDLAAQVAHAIAAGDLSTPIKLRADDRSSMLAAMQDMQRHLAEVVRKIQDEADRVSSTAEQLSVSSSQVADSSRQQSSAAASMAASVEELTVSIDHVAARADEAANISSRSGELSAQGSEVIHNAADEMHRIESSVRESAGIIEALEQRSDQISAVVNVIKDIADQTNLLALNAAIEAARAGESGRGFAVVADEVRKLSERTAQSTQEIAPMILQIQEGARQAVASMQSGVAQANRGVALASEAGNSIVGIKAEAERVVDAVDDISYSLKEQSSASAEIARNVETIAQMTEENSAAVTETSAAAHHLEQMAISLQQTVAHFRLA